MCVEEKTMVHPRNNLAARTLQKQGFWNVNNSLCMTWPRRL